MNRRIVSVLLSGLLVAAAGVPMSAAQAKRMPRHVEKRTVSLGYNYVASSSERPLHYNVAEPVVVDVKKRELWTAITIEDKTTRPVGATVTQDLDDDGNAENEWEICGDSPSRLRISARTPLVITPTLNPCSEEAGVATSGTIHVDLFSPAPKPSASIPKVERIVGFSYAAWLYDGGGQVAAGAYAIRTYSSEGYVSVSATDATGVPVHVHVQPENGRSFSICGSSDESIPIEPDNEIHVSVWPDPCPNGSPAAMTMGQIEVTLSNVP